MNIEMVQFTSDHVIPENGKYLVKAVSTSHLKTEQFLQARCVKSYNEKHKRWETSVDVSNQTVLLISKIPVV